MANELNKRLLDAAKVYANNYVQDEADPGYGPGDLVCSEEQHKHAIELFAAIADAEAVPAASAPEPMDLEAERVAFEAAAEALDIPPNSVLALKLWQAARAAPARGELSDADVDDMAFGYAPGGKIDELRGLIRAAEARIRGQQGGVSDAEMAGDSPAAEKAGGLSQNIVYGDFSDADKTTLAFMGIAIGEGPRPTAVMAGGLSDDQRDAARWHAYRVSAAAAMSGLHSEALDAAVDKIVAHMPARQDDRPPAMGAGSLGEPLAILTLGGIDGNEYDDNDIEIASSKRLDELQRALVKTSEPVTLELFARPTASGAVDLWQPIETAPKDGRALLLGRFNEMGNWRTMRGQWTSQAEIDNDWEDPDGHEQGWYEVAITPDAPNCWSIAPTHWQPLPVRPTANGAGDLKGGA